MRPSLMIRLAVLARMVSAITCSNYGAPNGDTCLCPPGFNPTGTNGSCALPVCGGSLYSPSNSAPATSGYGNVSSGNCGCSTGWTGPGCTVCTSASSCTSSLSKYLNSSSALTSSLNTSMTCSNVPTTYSTSELTCSVVQSTLQALFPLSSTLTITRALNASLTPGGVNTLTQSGLVQGNGQVWAQLWYQGVEQFYCQAGSCSQSVGPESGSSTNASIWTCPTLNCTCVPGTDFCGGGFLKQATTPNLTSAINTLVGPLVIDCSPLGTCAFKQSFLNNLFGDSGLQLSSCSFGECVQQYVIDQATNISTAEPSNGLSGGVIAGLAVVGAILLAIIGLVIWGLVLRKRARKGMRTDGVLPKSDGVGIDWSGVGYEILNATNMSAYDKTIIWLRGRSGPKSSFSKTDRKHEIEGGTNIGPNGGKIVLKDAGGHLPPGAFCCILGPSGAGKSTLVDILAGKRKAGRVEGSVGFVERGREGKGRVKIGYVDQSDILSPTSTVLETMIFAAQLRLPENIPSEVKISRAETVLSQLGLTEIADTRVGSIEHRGISGGEMRRVSIGIELVAQPDVLVLDEPTSGLDSVSASRLIKLLKDLTQNPESRTTIIASIHQPSSALYHSFDQVVLLSRGRQLYFGPGREGPVDFFTKQGKPCPPGYNIADHLLEIASGGCEGLLHGPDTIVRPVSAGSSTSGIASTTAGKGLSKDHNGADTSDGGDLHAASNHLGENGDNTHLLETPYTEKLNEPVYPPTPLLKHDYQTGGHHHGKLDLAALSEGKQSRKRKWLDATRSHCATTFLTQLEVLSGREWKNLKRDKTLLIAHVGLACILGVFAGGLYFKVGLTIAGFQNRVGSLFFLGSLIAFSSLSALYNLVEVRPLFLRERAGNFYSPNAWLLSRVIFDVIPLRLIPTILVGVIVYFMVGLSRDAARFFKYLLILVEYSLGMTLFNFLLACVFRHGGIAILLSSLYNLFLMTYAGFFVNLSQIPPVLRWLRYFSTLGYTLEALSINEVGSGLQIIDSLDGVDIEINAIVIMETLFGFDLGNYYRDVLVLFAFIAGYALLLVGTVLLYLRERR